MFNHNLRPTMSPLDRINTLMAPLILVLLGIAFVVSDWLFSYFTFSEYILFFVLAYFLFTMNFRLSKDQLQSISILVIFLIVHGLVHYLNSSSFELRIAVPGMVKLIFYSVSVSVIINYIQEFEYQESFLIINNAVAVITIILGIYITYQLYQDSRIPQELFWRFTRRDIYSYYFESNPTIIRSRSIFSEPAHLGFYLNTLITANLFSVYQSKLLHIMTAILSIGIILTFSYSMIGILVVILIIKGYHLLINKQFSWSKWYLLIPIALIVLAVINWEAVNTALIQRTIAILSGEDTSARMRLFDSWQYVTRENFLWGNGIGHTPVVTNVYAYALSDFGIFGLVLIFTATGWLIYTNWSIGLVFFLLNSAKGGYLSSSYWLMILVLLLYGMNKEKRRLKLPWKSKVHN